MPKRETKANRRLAGLKKLVLGRELLLSVVIAIALIGVGVFLGWYNNRVVPVNPDTAAHYTAEPSNHLSFMSNWDGPDYLYIAAHGYDKIGNTSFFPLYPALVHVVGKVIGSPLNAALLISWLSLIVAVYFYIKIFKKIFNISQNAEAARGLLFFILFPTAMFMLATYTESLFAALALGTIYFALSKKYLPAALPCAFCTATHVTGVFVLLLMGMLLYEHKEKLTKIALALALGSLGLLSYMYFLQAKFHQPLAFVTTQKSGHGWLKGGYGSLVSSATFFNFVFVALIIVAAVYWWPRRKSFAVYSFLFLLIPLVGKQYGGFNRYVLMAFPIPFMLYGWLQNKKTAYSWVVALFSVTWAYFLLQYAGGYVGG